jgi:hypothetical protein
MRFFASLEPRRNRLALGLCLLAVLFAVEAKTAWYGPANGLGVDIQSQKALPADLPTAISHGISACPHAPFPLALLLFASLAATARKGPDCLPGIDIDFNHIPFFSAPYFSAGLFFRPPPAL